MLFFARLLPRARPSLVGLLPTQQTRLKPCRAAYATAAASIDFGQPLHETHPHLLEPGQLTPGISALEYAERRSKLAQALPQGSVAILAASDLKYRSGAVFYPFRQESNFFYLTGFNEPEALAVIDKRGPGSDYTFHLFVRPKDAQKERWEGSRSGMQAALDVFNADEAGDINTVTTTLPSVLDGASHVYTDIPAKLKERSTWTKIVFGSSVTRAQRFGELLERSSIKPLRPFVNELRMAKSEAEIKILRKVGQLSGRAFNDAMRQDFTNERGLESFIEYQFKTNGCDGSAYVPVVAGGEHANQIHYVRNDAPLQDGQLVCVDAGGELGGYITDITRTWPVNGKFTTAQRDMYEMILNTQRRCVSFCRENASMSLDKLHHVAEESLRDGLQQLGFDLSKDGLEALLPHHVGHYIGLDVHDAPGYPRTSVLKSGQCITIEPGIYVDNSERWPKHFRGMGIRIEDSICIQDEAPLVLTSDAVKELVDIEALRR